MKRIVIITSENQGFASLQLMELLKSNKYIVCGVVLSRNKVSMSLRFIKRKILKTHHIGIFGVVNGFRMRSWYSTEVAKKLNIEPIDILCKENNIPFFSTSLINSQETEIILKKLDVDLGLSLGNSFISSRIFNIPKYGMLNVHHEILPDYQNAQSVIWQIYNSSKMTGFSIHKVSKTIDTGEILFKEIIPIQFSTDLRTTVIVTNIDLWKQSSFSLRYVLDNFGDFYFNAEAQVPGRKYTTPSFLQYIRIKRNFNRLKS